MASCPEECDASCYRCLRSFKNKFEHSLLDPHVGAELIEYLLTGEQPGFNPERLRRSTTLLYHDLQRQEVDRIKFERDVPISTEKGCSDGTHSGKNRHRTGIHYCPFQSTDD